MPALGKVRRVLNLLRHALGLMASRSRCPLQPGPGVLQIAAGPIEDLRGTISSAEPEGKAKGKGQRAHNADQESVDERGGYAQLIDRDNDGKAPNGNPGYRGQHVGIGEPGLCRGSSHQL